MQHRNAVIILKALTAMLAACLDEKHRVGFNFDRTLWAKLSDLVETPLITAACARLDEREEDRALLAELGKLLEDVTRIVAQREADISPEEFEIRVRETYPLFPEADSQDAHDVKMTWESARTKSPENRTDHFVHGRLHIVEMLEDLLAAGRIVLISRSSFDYEASVSGPTKYSIAKTLEGCIEGLTDNPRTKICSRPECQYKGQPKPL
jgi:hypothetical protein